MSAIIDNNVIKLTRGDTLRAQLRIMQGELEYRPQEGDVVRFALKHPELTKDGEEFIDKDPLINKVIPNDTLILELEPEDTKDLGFGSYVYDIELTYADGTVDTFITKAKFKLTEEVH